MYDVRIVGRGRRDYAGLIPAGHLTYHQARKEILDRLTHARLCFWPAHVPMTYRWER